MSYDGDDFAEMKDKDIEKIALKEAEKQAIRFQTEWQDNMIEADYKNTGEAINSITVERIPDGFRIGTDKIQAIVGEFGRSPGTFPNVNALAEWVNEQTGLPDRGDSDFDNAVYNIGKQIAEEGLPPYRFARSAWENLEDEYEQRVQERLEE